MTDKQNTTIGFILLATASVFLAFFSITWLVRTWRDPAYGSAGYVFLAGVLALFLWSFFSGPANSKTHPANAILLLIGAALVRFLSQISAVNFLGGLALCIDAYALFKLAGLDLRPRAISSFWLAVLFALSLPIERLLQRFGGLILQDISAFGSCHTLGLFFNDLECAGTRLILRGHEILVDLPCSGTASLMIVIACVTVQCAVHRPAPKIAVLWFGFGLSMSAALNSLRVTFLAVGVTYGDVLPFDVLADPAHGIIGLTTLGLTVLPLLSWFRATPWIGTALVRIPALSIPARYSAITGAVALCFALAIVVAPRTAWDISTDVELPAFPTSVYGANLQNHLLSAVETQYFEQYGGMARKVSYGPMGVTVVRTTSPLRHLHSPEECLRGLGFQVDFTGTHGGHWPGAIYTAQNAQGNWHVAVTFAADDGFVTSNMSAVIWHWLKNPGTVWSSYQRITPANLSQTERHKLDAALMASFDVPRSTFQSGDNL